MHAAEREQAILDLLKDRDFISVNELDRRLDVSVATLRRDLDRLEADGKIMRVRGGVHLVRPNAPNDEPAHLRGVPFHENIGLRRSEKEAIGKAAAALCAPGESIIIDGGSTTLQMCPHLAPLGLQVLTNSLHIASALLPQPNTRISLPAGSVFREQNIVLSPFEDDGADRYRASKMFLGAASIGRHGLMQTDVILVQAERRLLARADKTIVLVDSSKFDAPAGHAVCDLSEINIVVTDKRLTQPNLDMLIQAGIELIVA